MIVFRLIFVVIGFVCTATLVYITMIGKGSNEPIGQPRKWLVLFWYKIGCSLLAFVGIQTWITSEYMSHEDVNYYEEYLGRQRLSDATARDEFGEATEAQRHKVDNEVGPFGGKPRVPRRGPGRAGIIVSNHLGFIEILALICSPLCPGFTPKSDLKEVALLGKLIIGL